MEQPVWSQEAGSRRSFLGVVAFVLVGIGTMYKFVPDAKLYFLSLLDHTVTLLAGCGATVVLGLIQKYVLRKPLSVKWEITILGAFVFVAGFQAWQDEYRKAKPAGTPVQVTNQISVPPAQVVVIEKTTEEKHDLTSFVQFSGLIPTTVQNNNVIAPGNRIGFNFFFQQKGPEPVDDLGNVEMVDIVDTNEKDAESNVRRKFKALIVKALANTKKAGAKGHSLGIGQGAFNSANTERVLSQNDVNGILLPPHTIRIYAQGWLGWKDRHGNSGHVNECVWLQPPSDGILRPGVELIWDECEEKR